MTTQPTDDQPNAIKFCRNNNGQIVANARDLEDIHYIFAYGMENYSFWVGASLRIDSNFYWLDNSSLSRDSSL